MILEVITHKKTYPTLKAKDIYMITFHFIIQNIKVITSKNVPQNIITMLKIL